MMTAARDLDNLCRRHRLGLVYLFGSRQESGARLLAGERVALDDSLSDLDVGVVTLDPLPAPRRRRDLYAELYNELAGVFEPLPVDLVLLEENHSVFQVEALKGICVYQVNEEFRDDYELRILRRAADFRPMLERYLQERLEEV